MRARSLVAPNATQKARPENLVVAATAIAEASPFPRQRTKTPRECPGGRRGRPKRPGAVIRPGWPPERGGWALSGALSPRKTNRKVRRAKTPMNRRKSRLRRRAAIRASSSCPGCSHDPGPEAAKLRPKSERSSSVDDSRIRYSRAKMGAALLRRRPKGLLPAARQELLDPSKAWWGGRRGRLADWPPYSISVSLGVVPRWYSRVVEVPVRIEVAAGFVAPGASEPPRLQPSWPPGGSRPAHG